MDNIKLLDSINKDKEVFYDELKKVLAAKDNEVKILKENHIRDTVKRELTSRKN